MGYTATQAGMVLAPVGAFALLLSPVVGKNIAKVDPRRFAAFAFMVFALVLWMRSHFNTQADFQTIMIPTIIQGVAMAFFFIPLVTITLSGIAPEKIPAASGLSNFVRITAGSFGTSIATTIWQDRAAMTVRDAIVAGFGLKTAKHLATLDTQSGADRLGIFKIYSTSPTEVVLGEDDKHLDFRLSVLCSGQPSPGAKRHLIMSTVVHCHNRLGRLYIFLIAPFHRLVVQSSLRSAARAGWPSATEA